MPGGCRRYQGEIDDCLFANTERRDCRSLLVTRPSRPCWSRRRIEGVQNKIYCSLAPLARARCPCHVERSEITSKSSIINLRQGTLLACRRVHARLLERYVYH